MVFIRTCVCRIFTTRRIFSFYSPRQFCNSTMADVSILGMCDFKMTPEEILSRADSAISACRKICNLIANVPDNEVEFETVLKPLNDVDRKYLNAFFPAEVIHDVSTDVAQRKAGVDACQKLKDFLVEKNMRPDLFEKVQILDKKKLNLTAEYKYYLEKLMESGKKFGLHLPADVQEKIKMLKQKINEKCLQFIKNLGEANTVLEFSDSELDGLPENFINSLTVSADTGKRVVTMKYPHYFPIMKKCRNPNTRKAMNIAFESRCLEENTALLEEIIDLRHEAAVLLGFKNHASLVAADMIAKTQDNVKKFLMELYEKARPVWLEEKKQWLQLKEQECKELNIPFDGVLNQWDLGYYGEKSKELKCNLDTNKLREYFPEETVTKGMFKIYEKLLGLVFTEIENPKVWHPEVRLFSVKNASDGELQGYFFLDLFPREGKYGHAGVDMLQYACTADDGTRQIPVIVVMTNFPAPTADRPSLLSHSGDAASVETYFHEFGHVMHKVCSKNEVAKFVVSSVYMKSDSLEIPSQMLENWCWDVQPLKLMSGHYVTGDPLPDDIITNLISSRSANIGSRYVRQIIFSLFDQEIHSQCKVDTKALLYRLKEEMLGVLPVEGTNFGAHFQHMCNDYDATYFGYLWSEVSSIDMFETVFKGKDLTDPELGKLYRKIILEPAASKDMSDILREFLGRDPTQDAFLRVIGLKE